VGSKSFLEIKGFGVANSLLVLKDRGSFIGSVKADEHGKWRFSMEGLRPGSHRIEVKQQPALGDQSRAGFSFYLGLDRRASGSKGSAAAKAITRFSSSATIVANPLSAGQGVKFQLLADHAGENDGRESGGVAINSVSGQLSVDPKAARPARRWVIAEGGTGRYGSGQAIIGGPGSKTTDLEKESHAKILMGAKEPILSSPSLLEAHTLQAGAFNDALTTNYAYTYLDSGSGETPVPDVPLAPVVNDPLVEESMVLATAWQYTAAPTDLLGMQMQSAGAEVTAGPLDEPSIPGDAELTPGVFYGEGFDSAEQCVLINVLQVGCLDGRVYSDEFVVDTPTALQCSEIFQGMANGALCCDGGRIADNAPGEFGGFGVTIGWIGQSSSEVASFVDA
jgi:hypothetical protein